jgi:hypothetical protein
MAPRFLPKPQGNPKHFGPRGGTPATPIGLAKAAARRAWQACRADPALALFGDRVWSTTLAAVELTNDADKIETMFTRAGLALEIAVDMRGWPQRVSGL